MCKHGLIEFFGYFVLNHRSKIHIKESNQGPLVVCGCSADLGSRKISFTCVNLGLDGYKKIYSLVSCPANSLSCTGEPGECFSVGSPDTHIFLEVVGNLLEHLLSESVNRCLALVVSNEGVCVGVVDLNPHLVGIGCHNIVLSPILVGGGGGCRGYVDFDWLGVESTRVVSTVMLWLLTIR